jgi:hypothetical protein
MFDETKEEKIKKAFVVCEGKKLEEKSRKQ